VINGMITACNYDLCALEGQSSKQNELRCSIFSTFTKKCYDYGFTNNINFNFAGWRDAVQCRKLTFNNNKNLDFIYI
jgi:hypothetical protein